MGGLIGVSLGLFALLYLVDHYVTGGTRSDAPGNPISRYFLFDPDAASNSVSALGGLIAAVLGIVITVVSIVVQLSAGKYAGVAEKFFRDRTNLLVLGYYIVSCVLGIWLSLSVNGDFVPRTSLIAMMVLSTVGLVLMAPYFAYVFWFLEPENIIGGIREAALGHTKAGGGAEDERTCGREQTGLVGTMEELTDIASGSIGGKDKIIASRAVDALKDYCVEYIRLKEEIQPVWFQILPAIRRNPAFVAMDPESRGDLEKRRTWVEWKVMRQLLGIYHEALVPMRDVAYLIAIDTRYIGEASAFTDDVEGVQLVLRYMNSYLRATINAKEVRTAYNVLNQYRLFVESLLRLKRGSEAVQAVGHMKYYGQVCQDMKLLFVTETVAFDMAESVRIASELRSPEEERLLSLFLDLDRPLAGAEPGASLPGIRKAQAKLAAYYILVGKQPLADRIREDMRREPKPRLRAIRDELMKVETKDFWEIIDRGRNFDFMPPDQRACLSKFFSFLEDAPAPPPGATTDAVASDSVAGSMSGLMRMPSMTAGEGSTSAAMRAVNPDAAVPGEGSSAASKGS